MEENSQVTECEYQVGYRVSILRCLLVIPLAVLPLFTGLLLMYWFPHVATRVLSTKVPLCKAQIVIVKDLNGKYCVEKVKEAVVPSVFEKDYKGSKTISFLPQTRMLAYFEHRHIRFFYHPEKDRFVKLNQLDSGKTFDFFHDATQGLDYETQDRRWALNGRNLIDVPVKPLYSLFIDEVLHPFYIFEFITVAFWMADEYYYYSGCIILIQLISIVISLYQSRKQAKQLHDLVVFRNRVTVRRKGVEVEGVCSEMLVPGDVIVIPKTGLKFPCDAVLVSGTAIVNESLLTGESVPVTKTALPHGDGTYFSSVHKRHTIYCGTEIIQTRYYREQKVLAICVSTGFWTVKGGLVRSILFPKQLNVKLWKDSIKFVLTLGVLAFFGVVYSLTVLLIHGYEVEESIFKSLDVITILVPPALPAALTVSTVYSIARLRKQNIYCISPQRINLCGKIKLACFDKTGTLTEDSMSLLGVKPSDYSKNYLCQSCSSNSMDMPAHQPTFDDLIKDPLVLPENSLLIQAMACTHSLTLINSVVSGDPLDQVMLKSTGWVLEEPGEDTTRYDIIVPRMVKPATSKESTVLGIMKQFTFSSDLQRMSVLVRSLPQTDPRRTDVFVKGSPEMISQLCLPDTMPDQFNQVLAKYAHCGYRVLALAHKVMSIPWHKMEKVNRTSVESDLTFLGLLVLQNQLKKETTPVIKTLTTADIRVVMATGDNLLTATCVARECGMVAPHDFPVLVKAEYDASIDSCSVTYESLPRYPSIETSVEIENESKGDIEEPLLKEYPVDVDRKIHLVMSGQTFECVLNHKPELIPRLVVAGTVFARMSPNHKQLLVENLQSLGYNVMMCGDGANDCGALKAAHAGISLSESEASIAAPFTSKKQDIECVPKVIREGRASLVTTFSLFQFMALYSIAEFVTAATLYFIESNLSDFQYLFVDLILALAVSFGMGYSGPSKRLVKRRPLGTLVGPIVVSSLVIHTLWIVCFQVGVWFYLRSTLWYYPLQPDPNGDNFWRFENAALFQFSNFQYITLALILSAGPPYRQPAYRNLYLMIAVVILLPFCIFITLAPAEWFHQPPLNILTIEQSPSWMFRIALVELAFLNFLFAYFLKVFVLDTAWYRSMWRVLRRKKKPKNKYKEILQEIERDTLWPPLLDPK